jgi:hypothetical protein
MQIAGESSNNMGIVQEISPKSNLNKQSVNTSTNELDDIY